MDYEKIEPKKEYIEFTEKIIEQNNKILEMNKFLLSTLISSPMVRVKPTDT